MRLLRRLGHRGQTGQSLVILAIGFLALLGFVGIVTDVSVLFIRYSTMRRAVDAAAIAAAGQMRRVQDTKLGQSTPIADGQATSVANLNLAARQFIEVYGLNPKSVVVETCRSQQVGLDPAGKPYDASYWSDPPANTVVNPNAHPLFNADGTVNTAANQEIVKKYKQLCTSDELKLVRVTAQIDAPTIFLRLLGYPTVTLTESAISQTAVIDAVLIFDTAPSMANETTYDDWHTIPGSSVHMDVRYIPPYIDNNEAYDPAAPPPPAGSPPDPWQFVNNNDQATINAEIAPTNPVVPNISQVNNRTIRYEKNAAGTGFQEWVDAGGGVSALGVQQPPSFCQVRAYTGTYWSKGVPWVELLQDDYSFLGDGTFGYSLSHPNTPTAPRNDFASRFYFYGPASPSTYAVYDGFVPMYNSPACCNDPLEDLDAAGNLNFKDLICQPFKDARNAAEGFLDRLDFLRGDRVGYVLFDKSAVAIDPDGSTGPQAEMIETQNNLPDPTDSTKLLRKGAVETLRDVVGVQINSYLDMNNDGLWDALNDGGTPRTYSDFLNGVHVGDIVDNPVSNACPYDKAILDAKVLPSAEQKDSGGNVRPYLLSSVLTVPSWYTGGSDRFHSYEYQASCAHANVGGALGKGSEMLYKEGRREGAVWIMVMLSDGAAGASDPISRYNPNNTDIVKIQPYNGNLPPIPGSGGPDTSPAIAGNGGYGSFGLCPYGTSGARTQLLLNTNFPICSDLDPATRHYCGTVASSPTVSLDADPNCFNYYDVDDYAHDWADWIGLADLPGSASGGVTGRVSDQLLPTLFTIGYGINFEIKTATDCNNQLAVSLDAYYKCRRGDAAYPGNNDSGGRQRLRDADYMGEELLRYIADVGDNFQLDSDYWQLNESQAPNQCDLVNTKINRIGNCVNLSLPNWGVRGPCEAPWTDVANPNNRGNTLLPRPPAESCGNYFNAPNGQKLQEVFNEIASRMFTRLSQ